MRFREVYFSFKFRIFPVIAITGSKRRERNHRAEEKIMEFKEILFEIDGAIATMTLNRADIRNAITHPEMIAEIKAVCSQVNSDMAVKVLIITAVDPRAAT